MPTIDNRVVRMTFDSSKFDKAISTTLKLVEAFEQALSFKNAESGVKRLQVVLDSISGKKASDEIDAVQNSIEDLDTASVSNKMGDVQKSMDDLDSKNVTDQMSAVSDSLDDADPTPFNNLISGMQQSAESFDLHAIPDAVSEATQGMQERFSAMDGILAGALFGMGNTIQNWALNTLGGIKNSIMQPINDGLAEYQTQMGAIQTILANTGRDFNSSSDIAEVNAALDELNEYADKTIYNFTEMTKNIGTFTAAGIEMEAAVPAIQGVANMAAISGSTSQQASNAMYQLSQALSTGSLKLQDWNSVVNAGMGGKVFQEALIRTAKNMYEVTGRMGEVTKEGYTLQEMFDGIEDGTYSFRETLTNEWITSDVLSDTLQQLAISYTEVGDARYEAAMASLLEQGYSKDEATEILRLAKVAEESATKVRTWEQLIDTTKEALGSGWTQTWRIILGDFKDATNLFTDLSNEINGAIATMDELRNGVLQSWADWGGRDALFGLYEETEEGVVELVDKGVLQHIIDAIHGWATPIKDAFNEVFGIFSDNFDKEYADVINEFGANSEEAATQYEHTLSTVYENVKNNSEEYKNAVKEYNKSLKDIAESDGIESQAYKDKQDEMTKALDDIVKNSDDYRDALTRLDETFKNATYVEDYAYSVQAVNEATDALKEYESSTLKPTIDKYGEDSKQYKEAVKNMNASEEHKALVAELDASKKALQECRDDYLGPVIEQYGEDSDEYRDAVFRLENSTEILYDTFNTSTGVMDWVGQDMSALTQGLKDFAATLAPSEDAMIGIKGAFEGLFAVVDIVIHAFVDLLGLAGGLISFVRIFTDPIFDFGLELLGALGQVILAIHDALLVIKNSIVAAFDAFNSAIFGSSNAIEVIRGIYHGFLEWLDIPGKLQAVVDFIRDTIGSIAGFIATGIGHIAEFGERVKLTIDTIKQIFAENEGIGKLFASIQSLGDKISYTFDVIASAIRMVTFALFTAEDPMNHQIEVAEQAIEPFQIIVDIFSALVDFIGNAAEAFSNFVDSVDLSGLNSVIFTIGRTLNGIIWSIRRGFTDAASSVLDSIDIFGLLSSVWNTLVTVGSLVFGVLSSIVSVIWNAVSGAFNMLVDIFGPIVSSFGLFNEEVDKTGKVVEETTEQVNPVIKVFETFGKIIKIVVDILTIGFFGAIKIVGEILQWLLFGVVAVIGGLIYFIDIPGKIAAAIDLISDAFGRLKDFIAPAVDGILDFVTKITDMFGVTSYIQEGIDAIREFFNIDKSGVEKTEESIDGMAQAMEFFTNVQQQAIALWEEIQRVAGEVKDAFMGLEPVKVVADFFVALRDDIATLPERIPLVDESGNIIIFSEAMKLLTDAFDYVSTLTPEKLFNDIITQVDNFIGWIWDTGANLANALSSPKNIVDSILSVASNFAQNVENFFPNVGGMISNGVKSLTDSAAELFSDGSFDSWWSFGEKIIDWFKDIPNKISEGFNNFVDILKSGENDLPPHMNEIGKHIGDFLDTLRNFDIAGVFNGIIDGIKSIPDKIKSLGDKIKEAFFGIKTDTEESTTIVSSQNPTASGIGSVFSGITDSAEQTEEEVDIFTTIFQTISDKIRAIGEFIRNIPENFINGISNFARLIGDGINAVLDYINEEMIGRVTSIFYKVAGAIAIWNLLKLEKSLSTFFDGVGNFLTKLSGKDPNANNILNDFRGTLISLAICLGTLAATVAVFSLIKSEDLNKAVITLAEIAGLFLAFYALAGVITKFLDISDGMGQSMLMAAAAISVMGIGLVITTKVIDYLSGWFLAKTEDWGALAAGVVALIGLSVLIGVMLTALSKGGEHALQAAAAMILVSGAIIILSNIIDILSGMLLDKNIIEFGAIASGLAILTLAMIGFGYAMNLVGEHGFGAAIAMLALAGSIRVIADALIDLTKIEYDQLALAAQTIAILLGEFLGALYLAQKVNMVAVAAGFLSFGGSIMMIGQAFDIMGKINYDSLVLIAQALVILVAEFGVIARFVNSTDLIKTGFSLIEFAGSLVIMSVAFNQMSDIPVDQLQNVAVVMVALVGAFGLLTSLTKEGDIVATGLALVAFSGSLFIMAMSLRQLSDIPVDQVQGVAIAMGGLVAVFGLFSAILSAIPGSTVVLIAFGAALVGLGISANLFALAFQVVVTTLPLFLAQVPVLVNAISLIGDNLGSFITAAIGLGAASVGIGMFSMALIGFGIGAAAAGAGALLLAGGLSALMALIGDDGSEMESAGENVTGGIFDGMIKGARQLPKVILDIGKNILLGFLEYFGIHSPSSLMSDMVGENIDAGIIEGMTNGMGGIGDSLSSGLGGLLSNIPNLLSENAPAIQDWFFNTALPTVQQWIFMAFDAAVGFFNENWPKFTDWLFNVAIPSVQDWFFNTAIPTVWGWIGSLWDSIVGFFSENWPKFTDWLFNVAIPGVQDWFFNTAIPSLWGWITSTFDSIMQFIGENAPKVVDWLFNVALPGIGNWILNTVIPSLGQWIVETFTNIMKWLGEKKEEVGKWLRETVLPGLKSWAESIPGKILDGLGDIAEFFKSTGENIVKGIKQGVLDGYRWVTDAITGLGNAALTSIKRFFGINSPSTVMRDEVGGMIDQGLAKGIIDYADDVKDASTRLGENIGENIGNGIASGIESTASNVQNSGNGLIEEVESDISKSWRAAREKMNSAEAKFKEADRISDAKREAMDDYYTHHDPTDPSYASTVDKLTKEWDDALTERERLVNIYLSAKEEFEKLNILKAHEEGITIVDDGDGRSYESALNWYNTSKKSYGGSIGVSGSIKKVANGSLGSKQANTDLYIEPVTTSSSAAYANQSAQQALINSLNRLNGSMQSVASYTQATNNKLSAMEQQIKQINTNIKNLKIYMDTGNLVGAIAPKMDEALGLRQVYVDRNIIMG